MKWHWRHHYWGYRLYTFNRHNDEVLALLEFFPTQEQADLLCQASILTLA